MINLNRSKFKSSKNNQYFIGEFEILIKDHNSLYSFFQTKKQHRKKIDSIKFFVKYDFLKNSLKFEELKVDGKSNENIDFNIQQFNQENKIFENRFDLRDFFNSLVEEL